MKQNTLKIIIAVLAALLAVNMVLTVVFFVKTSDVGISPSEEYKGYKFRFQTTLEKSGWFYINSITELSDEWIRITYHDGRPWDDGMFSMDVKKTDVYIITPKDTFGLTSGEIKEVRYDKLEKGG